METVCGHRGNQVIRFDIEHLTGKEAIELVKQQQKLSFFTLLRMQSAFIIQVLLPICCRRNAQVLLDKLAEEGQVGEVEFGAYFLDRLVAVAQLLADSAHSGLMYQVKW